MKRKHRRTRFNQVAFTANNNGPEKRTLKPGLYRIRSRWPQESYVGAFIVHADHTVEFYGASMIIVKDESVTPDA